MAQWLKVSAAQPDTHHSVSAPHLAGTQVCVSLVPGGLIPTPHLSSVGTCKVNTLKLLRPMCPNCFINFVQI